MIIKKIFIIMGLSIILDIKTVNANNRGTFIIIIRNFLPNEMKKIGRRAIDIISMMKKLAMPI
jgi:hypothetical protein